MSLILWVALVQNLNRECFNSGGVVGDYILMILCRVKELMEHFKVVVIIRSF